MDYKCFGFFVRLCEVVVLFLFKVLEGVDFFGVYVVYGDNGVVLMWWVEGKSGGFFVVDGRLL